MDVCPPHVRVKGAETVKRTPLDALFLFISPPSFDALEERLRGRGTETEEKIQARLQKRYVKRAKQKLISK